MPANKKYLSSTSQRVSKIFAAILGAYIVTMALHLAVGALLEEKGVLVITTAYSSFLLWVFFMIIVFLIKKAWHTWSLFAAITLVSSIIIIIFK